MPFGRWENFDACVQDFIGQGKDEESAKKICGALQARLGKESFSWVGDIEHDKENLIRGKALHPSSTVHPEEWPAVRVYLEEELQKAAHSLKGQPLLLDHMYPLDGKVVGAEYEDGAIEYVAELDDDHILDWIKDGTVKYCSVEYDWSSLVKVDGVAPKGLQFTGLALLKNFEPGDLESSVEVWEGIIKILKEQGEPQEFIYYELRDPAAFLEDRFSTVWIDKINGVQGIYGRLRANPENPQPMSLLFMKANGWDMDQVKTWLHDHPQYVKGPEEPSAAGVQVSPAPPSQISLIGEKKMNVEEFKESLEGYPEDIRQRYLELLEANKTVEELKPLLEAEWDTEYINDLPDSAFAFIEPGGEKDDQGKTAPRSLRHFPYKNAEGNLDHDHIVNGLAWLGQDLGDWATEDAKAQIKKKLCAAASSWNEEHEDKIESEVCKIEEQEPPSNGEPPRAGEPKTDKERLIAHYGEEVAQKLLDLIGEDAYKLLPERGSKVQSEKLEALKGRIEALEHEKAELTEKLGEGVIDPQKREEDFKETVLGELRAAVFERIPRNWGYGPYEQNRRIKRLIKRLEA